MKDPSINSTKRFSKCTECWSNDLASQEGPLLAPGDLQVRFVLFLFSLDAPQNCRDVHATLFLHPLITVLYVYFKGKIAFFDFSVSRVSCYTWLYQFVVLAQASGAKGVLLGGFATDTVWLASPYLTSEKV